MCLDQLCCGANNINSQIVLPRAKGSNHALFSLCCNAAREDNDRCMTGIFVNGFTFAICANNGRLTDDVVRCQMPRGPARFFGDHGTQ